MIARCRKVVRSTVEAELSTLRRHGGKATAAREVRDLATVSEDANDDEERIGCSYPRAMRSGCTQNQHQSQPI